MNITWAWAAEYFRELPTLAIDEQTRAHRRNLLVALGVVTCYYVVGITPGGFSAAFVSGSFQRPYLVELFLWLIVVYELIMFHLARMVDEIKYYDLHEHYMHFKIYLNYAHLRKVLAEKGFLVTSEKKDRNSLLALAVGKDGDIAGSYRFTSLVVPEELRSRTREDQLKSIEALQIPGLSLSVSPDYDVDYRHPNTVAEDAFFRKAFPRIRRLTASEFMLLFFPYWAVLVSVLVRVGMALLASWGGSFAWFG